MIQAATKQRQGNKNMPNDTVSYRSNTKEGANLAV